MMCLEVWRNGTFQEKTATKQVCYWLQTRTVEWLSARHQTVLATFLGIRKLLYSCTEGMCHSSTHPVMSLHMTHFYQRRPGYDYFYAPWISLGAWLRVRVSLGQCRLWHFWKCFWKCFCDVMPHFIMLLERKLFAKTTIWFLRCEDYMCLLHEASPTNCALAHEAYTVLMQIPSYCNNLYSQGCSLLNVKVGSEVTTYKVNQLCGPTMWIYFSCRCAFPNCGLQCALVSTRDSYLANL